MRNLSLALLTLAVLGVQMSWGKGDRVTEAGILWIGVKFSLRWVEGVFYNEVPNRMKEEMVEMFHKCGKSGMIATSELRTLAGKLFWTASIYRRARWTISVSYRHSRSTWPRSRTAWKLRAEPNMGTQEGGLLDPGQES